MSETSTPQYIYRFIPGKIREEIDDSVSYADIADKHKSKLVDIITQNKYLLEKRPIYQDNREICFWIIADRDLVIDFEDDFFNIIGEQFVKHEHLSAGYCYTISEKMRDEVDFVTHTLETAPGLISDLIGYDHSITVGKWRDLHVSIDTTVGHYMSLYPSVNEKQDFNPMHIMVVVSTTQQNLIGMMDTIHDVDWRLI